MFSFRVSKTQSPALQPIHPNQSVAVPGFSIKNTSANEKPTNHTIRLITVLYKFFCTGHQTHRLRRPTHWFRRTGTSLYRPFLPLRNGETLTGLHPTPEQRLATHARTGRRFLSDTRQRNRWRT